MDLEAKPADSPEVSPSTGSLAEAKLAVPESQVKGPDA
jgi:hypothetical protein